MEDNGSNNIFNSSFSLSPIFSMISSYSENYTTNYKKLNSRGDTLIGAAVTLSVSITFLRWVAQLYQRFHSSPTHDHHNMICSSENIDESKDNRHNIWRFLLVSPFSYVWQFLVFKKSINELKSHHTHDSIEDYNSGDAYFKLLYRYSLQQLRKLIPFSDSGDRDRVRVYHGSCHCNLIQFEMKSHIQDSSTTSLMARDSPGKIRYPHVQCKASQFEFVSDSENKIQIYHVTLGNTNINAAHAFCPVCSVPIFRAPNAQDNTLEVNMNCMNYYTYYEMSSSTTPTKQKDGGFPVVYSVAYYESPTQLSAGYSNTAKNQLRQQHNNKDSDSDDDNSCENDSQQQENAHDQPDNEITKTHHHQAVENTHLYDHYYYTNHNILKEKNNPAQGTPNTTTTSSTTMPFVDGQSSSIMSGGNASMLSLDSSSAGVSQMPAAPSTTTGTQIPQDLTSTHTASVSGTIQHKKSLILDSSRNPLVLQNQLKYYMKRHISNNSSTSSTHSSGQSSPSKKSTDVNENSSSNGSFNHTTLSQTTTTTDTTATT